MLTAGLLLASISGIFGLADLFLAKGVAQAARRKSRSKRPMRMGARS